MNCYDIS